MSIRALTVFVVVLGLFCAPGNISAQGADTLSIQVDPQAPGPRAEVVVRLSAFPPLSLPDSTVSWSVNGTPLGSGIGVSRFTFTMGALGEVTTLAVRVAPRGGVPVERVLRFSPGELELVVEPLTYTPPFYQGRPLLTPGALVRLVALPVILGSSGARVPSEDLSFVWERNGERVVSASGIGKDTYTFRSNQLLEAEEVRVLATRPDGTLAAERVVRIPIEDPVVRFYAEDPLRGILYGRALEGEVVVAEQEFSIVAEPYFFSGESRTSFDLSWGWNLNGKAVSQERGGLTLRGGEGGGEALLSLAIGNEIPARVLQEAGKTLRILFGVQSTSLFGI